MTIADLKPRRHDPPPDWPAEVFERLTDALAAALVAAVRRAANEPDAAVEDTAPAGDPGGPAP